MSAFLRVRIDRASVFDIIDPEILRTDWIVGRAQLRLRRVLIRHYCTRGHVRAKAMRMGLARSTYFDLLEEARWFVHTEYDKPDAYPVAPPDRICYLDRNLAVVSLTAG
jgi:hypothetical protein